MPDYIMICIIFTWFGALGGFCFKKAAVSAKSVANIAVNPFLYFGGGMYFISSILNIYVLKKLEYTVVLPFTSITYIWTMIISVLFMREKMSLSKILGVLMIISGAVILSTWV